MRRFLSYLILSYLRHAQTPHLAHSMAHSHTPCTFPSVHCGVRALCVAQVTPYEGKSPSRRPSRDSSGSEPSSPSKGGPSAPVASAPVASARMSAGESMMRGAPTTEKNHTQGGASGAAGGAGVVVEHEAADPDTPGRVHRMSAAFDNNSFDKRSV